MQAHPASSHRVATTSSRPRNCTCRPHQHLHRRPTFVVMCSSEASGEGGNKEIKLTLKKPVGVVFAQKPGGGPIYVEEVTPGGEADKTGQVKVGDVLSRCSAVILKSGTEGQFSEEGYGQRPYDNFQRVDFDCKGQEFKTVMAALKSNNARWGILDVTLVFERQE